MYNLIEWAIIIQKHQEVCGIITEMIQMIIQQNLNRLKIKINKIIKVKIKLTGKNPVAGNTTDVEIAMPLKYLSNFWRTLDINQLWN